MVLTFCAALLSRLWIPTHRHHEALQWWHQQQVKRLHEGAELIRDGILQELFAARRGLELEHDQQVPVSQERLQQLEHLHHRLESVSNQLYPAFVRDSLALAIQHILRQWQTRHPAIAISTDFPDELRVPTLHSHTGLTTLAELLNLMEERLPDGAALSISLSYGSTTETITVRVKGLAPAQCRAIATLKELTYLHHAFQYLTRGRSDQHISHSDIEWHFSWRSSECLK